MRARRRHLWPEGLCGRCKELWAPDRASELFEQICLEIESFGQL